MKNNKPARGFWIAEAFLLAGAAFFAFALVGYRTLSLCLLLAAAVVAAFYLLRLLNTKHPKTARALKIALICLLSGAAIVFAVAETPVLLSAKTDDEPEAPYLIVLGAGVNGTTPSLSLLNRLEAAKDYLNEYPNTEVVVSGGQGPGEDITEARCMKNWLTESGIDPQRIIMEDSAVSTEENIWFSLQIIEEHGGNPRGRVAIASSEYHLYRAKYYARQLGAEPVGVAGKTSFPVLRLNYFIREAAAVLYLWVF